MALRIARTLPPAAAPIRFSDILSGIGGLFGKAKTVGRFEEELSSYYGVRYCFTVSSGKAALVLILQALHELHPERDEVLIPAYTCYSVPSAITRAGLRVWLCDTAPGSFDVDSDCLEKQLDNPRLLCVVPTHLFGLPAEVERVKRLTASRGIFVVEDAAQAMGGEWHGRKLGTLGDVGLFSLGRGKAFTTVEGGIILTDNDLIGEAIGNRLAALPHYRAFGCLKLVLYAVALFALIHPRLFWVPKSLPLLKLGETHFDPSFPIKRLSAFQAGLARGWQGKIGYLKRIRSNNARKIAELGTMLAGIEGGTFPDVIRFPVLMADAQAKRKVLRLSEAMGLGISDGYPGSIDGIEGLDSLSDGNGFPRARDIADRIILLPVHPFVRERDLRKMVQLLGTGD